MAGSIFCLKFFLANASYMVDSGKVNHYCTYPGRGGAGIAALRLVTGLRKEGVQAELIGVNPQVEDPGVRRIHYGRSLLDNIRRRLRKWQLEGLPDEYTGTSQAGVAFFSDRSAHGIAMAKSFSGSQILHFHWVCDFMDYRDSLSRVPCNIPVFWTLHDEGGFTGGCSSSLSCTRFMETCGNCPQMMTSEAQAETRKSLQRKLGAIQHVKNRLTIICPSQWLARQAGKSAAFKGLRIEVIPNAHNLEIFNPHLREKGRQALGLEKDDRMILFVAASFSNRVKGMHVLLDALKDIQVEGKPPEVCFIGDRGEGDWPGNWRSLGQIHDQAALAEVYASADILAVPSISENYPNVIAEALASGVPSIASNVGGIPELVTDGKTGFLFPRGDGVAMQKQFIKLLSRFPDERNAWSQRCRAFAEKTFESSIIAQRHLSLYEEIRNQSQLAERV